MDFKKDPDWEAAVAAYQSIQQIKYDTGYRDDTKIIKVIYNGGNDITDLVKKVRPVIQDDLPFKFKNPFPLHVIYDYMYYQFQCVGDYSVKMMDGSDLNSQQGSNGLAWIFYRLATESGLDVTIVEDKGHYYITWRTDNGETVTIDVASDIKTHSKHGATTGLKDKQAFLAIEKNVIK